MSEISKYIDSSADQVESTGEFSISPTKAREKLITYLLTSTSDCLLKLVQAAVLLDSKSIALTISRYGFKIRANGARGPSPGDLERVNLNLLGDPICLAVHSLVQAGAEVVYERTSEGLQRITLPSSRSESEPSNSEAPGWSVEVNFKRGFLSSLVSGLKDRAALHKALHRCRFSPVPITLSQRDVIEPYPALSTRPFLPEPLGATLSCSRNFSLYEYYEVHRGTNEEGFRCIPASGRQAFKREPKAGMTPTLHAKDYPIFLPSLRGAVLYHETLEDETRGGESQLFRRAVRIPVHLQGNGQLTFIHAGVALETEAVKFPCPGVDILESLGDLKTDLSGLKLVRDEALQRRLNELGKLIRSGVEKIRETKGLLPNYRNKHHKNCPLRKHIEKHLPHS